MTLYLAMISQIQFPKHDPQFQSLQAATKNYHRLDSLYITNFFFHGSGGWKSEIRVPAWCDKDLLPSYIFLIVSSHGGKDCRVLWDLFSKSIISIHKGLPSFPHHLSKALLSNTISLGFRFSTYEFWGDEMVWA